MKKIVYTGVDIALEESRKEIIINPAGERFYYVGCEEQDKIYRDATLSYDEASGLYIIEGLQTLYNEHRDSSWSYDLLLCKHPKELIEKKSFLWMEWYSVSGVMSREIRSRCVCKHKAYTFRERVDILASEVRYKEF